VPFDHPVGALLVPQMRFDEGRGGEGLGLEIVPPLLKRPGGVGPSVDLRARMERREIRVGNDPGLAGARDPLLKRLVFRVFAGLESRDLQGMLFFQGGPRRSRECFSFRAAPGAFCHSAA
jgi:hypothetical protein